MSMQLTKDEIDKFVASQPTRYMKSVYTMELGEKQRNMSQRPQTANAKPQKSRYESTKRSRPSGNNNADARSSYNGHQGTHEYGNAYGSSRGRRQSETIDVGAKGLEQKVFGNHRNSDAGVKTVGLKSSTFARRSGSEAVAQMANAVARKVKNEYNINVSTMDHKTVRKHITEMDTSKFLNTDLKSFIANIIDDHDVDIDCFRPKNNLMSFKYQRNMRSTQADTHVGSIQSRPEKFILDQERRACKVKYEPKRDFQSAYKELFADRGGSNVVGDPAKGKVMPIKRDNKSETIDCSMYTSSYANQFAYYGLVPHGQQKKPATFQSSGQPLEKTTSYNTNTANVNSDQYKSMQKTFQDERGKVKDYKLAQQAGNLKPRDPKSMKFNAYGSPAKTCDGKSSDAVQRILPFNMLAVNHGLKMEYKTTAQRTFVPHPAKVRKIPTKKVTSPQ